jgi:DNA-binding response OmpR family regulator
VLLVDDNPETLNNTTVHLQAQGARVIALNSPFGVTNTVRRERPDVIVLDVMLPGLSGGGLGAIIRSESDAPIIYFSAMPEQDLRDLARVIANASYVLKSEGILFLTNEIDRLSRRSRPPSRAPRPT